MVKLTLVIDTPGRVTLRVQDNNQTLTGAGGTLLLQIAAVANQQGKPLLLTRE